MQCRKCGAKNITRRKAGIFSCRHCGIQPGQLRMDRGGIAGSEIERLEPYQDATYTVLPRLPKLRGITLGETR